MISTLLSFILVATGTPLSSRPFENAGFAEWLSVWSPGAAVLDSSAFTLTGSGPLPTSQHWVVADSGVTYASLAPSDVRRWLPSPDSTYAVCVLPFLDAKLEPMWEPDTEVRLCDFQRGTQRVILMCGTPCGFHVATWQDSHTVLIGGGDWDRVRPEVYRVDVVEGTVDTFAGPSLGSERYGEARYRLWEFRTEVFPWVNWYRPN